MPLHPQVKSMLDNVAAAGVPAFSAMPHEQSRAVFLQVFTSLPASAETLAAVEDRRIPGPGGDLGLRIYTPQGQGPFPLLLFFHGGGWVIGDLESYDTTCREICGGAKTIVVSVDYRRAPEHRCPAAADDAFAALQWLAAHAADIGGDASRIAVGGDSAGGNLAAITAIRARDAGGPSLCAQMLVYPVTAHPLDDRASMLDNADGYLLTRQDMIWFSDHYLGPDGDRQSPRFSPLKTADLSGLPPALVITAEFDPLRDEGEAYAAALKSAGVAVQQSRYDGAIHGFFTFSTALDLGREAMAEACAWLQMSCKATAARGQG